jgi:hypothetical protein
MTVQQQIEELKQQIEELRQILEELIDKPSNYPYPNDTRKCFDTIAKSRLLLKNIEESDSFRLLLENTPEDVDEGELKVSFEYIPTKLKEEWTKDGVDYTRTIVDNNISNEEIRNRMGELHLIKDTDSKGDTVLYPDS